jgi:hypothetical protein
LQDAQKNYTRTAKELNRVRSEYSEMENSMAKMRITLQSSSSNSTKDRRRVQELSEEVQKTTCSSLLVRYNTVCIALYLQEVSEIKIFIEHCVPDHEVG